MGVMSLVPQLDADGEVERLRLLIERQPTCLMRIGVDGVILAANDAALRQLGASQLGQALGRRFTQWMIPNHRDRWLDLVRRAYHRGAASVECELLDLAERRHAVQLQAVRQPPHPDGLESMTVAVREISGMSRLEQALQDQEAAGLALAAARGRLETHVKARTAGSEERARLQRELDEARAEQARLAARLAEHEAERRREQARHAEECAQLATLLAGAARSVAMAQEMVKAAPERLGTAGRATE
jgi:PAS domain S-box-containing protein